MKKLDTKRLVYLALLISLNIVLTRVASLRLVVGGIEGIRIGIGGFPVILAGIMFGPLAGGIVGAIGDVIGFYINPMGPYMPCFTLTAALTGVIPATILIPFRKTIPTLWLLILAIGIGQFITSIILVPYFLNRVFAVPILPFMPGRIISQVINIPIYAFLVDTVTKRISLTNTGFRF